MFLFLVSSCSFAPKYSRPDAPVQPEWPEGDAYQKNEPSSAQLCDTDWREFIQDECLRSAVENALMNNRDLRIAALNVEKVRARHGIQRGELFPSLSASGTGVRQKLFGDLVGTDDSRIVEQYSVDMGISWELDFFGRLRNLKKQALQEYFATEQARRGQQILLISEVARVYLTLAADRENLTLAESTLKTQQDTYSMIEKSCNLGAVSELDLRRAQIPLEIAKSDVARYTRLTALDRNMLDFLSGAAVPEEMLPVDFSNIKPFSGISAGLSSEALLNRPDIIAAEHRLKGAYAFIGAARAAFLPRISLTSSIGTASDELSGLFDSGTGTWSFIPKIIAPLFDARAWSALKVSKVSREIMITEYEKAIQNAFREVSDTLAEQGTIDRQLSAHESLVEASSEAYRLAESRYKAGIDSYLSVLDAQRSLYAQQQTLNMLKLTKLLNRIKLYAVLGGGAD